MKILILEDDKNRHEVFRKGLAPNDITIVETAKEAIDLLDQYHWDALFLDHDLGGQTFVASGPGTGYEVAVWLEEHKEKMPEAVYIHTVNPEGQRRMALALPNAIITPFLTLFPKENTF